MATTSLAASGQGGFRDATAIGCHRQLQSTSDFSTLWLDAHGNPDWGCGSGICPRREPDILRCLVRTAGGRRIALIGDNGSGKSTLFRLLARDLSPDRGAVTHRRGLTIGFLTQEPDLDPRALVDDLLQSAIGDPDEMERDLERLAGRLTEPLDDDEMAEVLDAYTAGLARLDDHLAADRSSEIDAILVALGIPQTIRAQRFATLSGGEKLVALARFSMLRPDVLLLDEPDNHLDADAKIWLEGYLAQYRGAVGLISHDRYMIDKVANEICELEDGKIQIYPGNYSAYREMKRNRLERALELRELAEREFKKLKASAEELTQWARQNDKFAPGPRPCVARWPRSEPGLMPRRCRC